MYFWQQKNIKIDKESKILIGLGCSFTQGIGACDNHIFEKYNWDSSLMYHDHNRDVYNSCYTNSWVNVICEKYLKDFIPINFGMGGRGNRGAAKELHMHPEINLEDAKEKIVVFMLSGRERYDFLHNEFREHVHYKTIWPFTKNDIEEKNLWNNFGEFVYGERFAVLELISTISEVKTWCKANNAKLVLISAFESDVNKENFMKIVEGFKGVDNLKNEPHIAEKLVNIIEWDKFLYPDGLNCISEFLLRLEGKEEWINDNPIAKYYGYAQQQKKLTPNGFITYCGHPSSKAHKEIAKLIYEHIKKLNYI